MKAKSSLRRYLSIIQGEWRKSTVSVFALCLFAVSSAFGATYYWKGGSSWADYGTLSNWSTESATGVDAESLPGAADSLATQKSYFDLGGKTWEIGIYSPGSGHRFYFTNGTFRVTKSSEPKGEQTHIYAGATVTCASGVSFCLGCWDANPLNETVHSGGILDYSPSSGINAHNWNLTIEAGGVARLCQKWWDGLVRTHTIRNSGTLDLSSGFFARQNSAGAKFNFTQNTGTLLLGGPFSNSGYANELTLTLSGGTLALAGEASFSATSVTVAENSSLIIDIPSGVDVDLTPVVFGQGAAITKTGAGDFTYMLGNMPSSLAVNEGGIILDTADTLYDLSDVTFAAGAKVKIGALGITLTSCDSSIASATFDVADGFIPSSGATVLTCADSSVLAQARAGLNASLASVGISVEVSGNSLVAESHYTFNSSAVSDMNDATGWVNGLAAPAGQPALIAGSTTEAVMDNAVPDYASIDVTDGATLTVAATRDFPELMLSAGTKLKVSPMSGTLLQSYDTCIPHSSAVVVGTMDPSASMTSLSDFSAKTAGTSFNSGSDITSILAKSLDDGETLLVQFKKHDDGHVKCAIVKFWQTDGTIYAQLVAARYWTTSASNIGHDFINADGTYNQNSFDMADTDSSRGYSIKQLSFAAPVSGEPSMVTAAGDFITTGSGSVAVDVAADCVLDLSGVDVTTEAALVKTGAGTIVFGDELPAPLDVQAGVLAVQPYVEYDMTGVTLGQGATVKVAIDGELKPCLATPGQNGTTVYMAGDTYVGVGGWDTLANWVSGELPDASAVVHVYGSETVLTLDAVPAAMPASIAVEGGATLKTATDVSLPTLTLDKQASLSIDSGITTLANGLVGVALVDGGNVTIPALSIMDGAMLSIPGGMNFSNVDIALYGTLYVSSMGKTTFGYAVSGETTYIGFRAEGGKIRLPSGGGYDDRRIGICCPQSGGRVVAVRDIVFKDMPTVGTHFPNWSYPDGFHLGVNNPADETFEVMFDNAKWGVDGNLYVYGGAAFRLRNGSSFVNSEEYGYWNRHAGVKGNGHIIVEGGCELRLNAMGNGGGTPFDVTVDQPGHEAVTVEDGGIFETFRWNGNANGVFSSSNGVLRIYNPRYDNDANNWHYVNEPFAKLSAVTLANDSCLTLTTRNGSSSTGFKDASGPRVVALANVPIVGNGGSVTLSNANVNAFGVVVRSGANTATGSASVTAVDGTGATTLYFANGANWAGMVVAGNVALTNLTDGAAAATATFGSLDLAADFPIRVWKSEGVYSADAINVGSFINNGGKISPVMVSEGEDFAKGDSFVIGKVAKGATLPAVATGWAVKARLIDGDDAYDEIVLKSGVGLQIIVR